MPVLERERPDWAELPWNRRFRRSISRAETGSVAVAVSPFAGSWKGLGRVINVAGSEKGLGNRVGFSVVVALGKGGHFRRFGEGSRRP